MRIPFSSLFVTSPFEGLQEHAEKVKECAWAYQQGIECYVTDKCESFEKFRHEIIRLEHEADAIKRRVRGHLPKNTMLPVSKFLIFRYIREQDSVLDSVKDSLNWLSYRPQNAIPKELEKDFFLLVDSVVTPIEELSAMVKEAREYFNTFSEKQRIKAKEIITTMRSLEHEADICEDRMNRKIFSCNADPVTVMHLLKLTEITGSIADHAENAGDMMRAMLAK